MKVKKFFASILTLTILISSLSLPSFAKSTIQVNGINQTYFGKNVDLDNWVKFKIPSFNGIPDRIPGDGAFYSNKGEIKLDINDQNRSYFENGGSVYIYVKKADNCLHLNPINYKNFLAFKPKDEINTFKINGPSQDFSQVFNSIGNALSFVFPNTTASILLSSLIFCSIAYFSSSTAFKFLLFSLFGPFGLKLAEWATAPISNLLANVNPNIVNFDYGIVLTDKDDEKVLNPNLPKVGDINEKALSDLYKQKEKDEATIARITNNVIPKTPIPVLPFDEPTIRKKLPESVSTSYRYTKQDIDKMKKEIEGHKATTYSKLANSTPINNGFVCKLDKDHPSETFRFVINNQFPDNPNNADLFALALQNNSINLSQVNTNVSFIASYNAVNPTSDVNARLANVPFEVQQKINLIQNIGNPGTLSKIIDWFRSFIDFFSFDSGKVNIPVPSAQSGQQGSPGAPGNGGQPPQGGGGNNPAAPGNGGQPPQGGGGNNPAVPGNGGQPPQGGGGNNPGAPGEPPVDPLVAQHQAVIRDRNAKLYAQALYNFEQNPTYDNQEILQRIANAYRNNTYVRQRDFNSINNQLNNFAPPPVQGPAPEVRLHNLLENMSDQWKLRQQQQRHWYNPFSWFK